MTLKILLSNVSGSQSENRIICLAICHVVLPVIYKTSNHVFSVNIFLQKRIKYNTKWHLFALPLFQSYLKLAFPNEQLFCKSLPNWPSRCRERPCAWSQPLLLLSCSQLSPIQSPGLMIISKCLSPASTLVCLVDISNLIFSKWTHDFHALPQTCTSSGLPTSVNGSSLPPFQGRDLSVLLSSSLPYPNTLPCAHRAGPAFRICADVAISHRFCCSHRCFLDDSTASSWTPGFTLAPEPVVNTAARVVLWRRKSDYVTLLFKTLRYFPISLGVKMKVFVTACCDLFASPLTSLIYSSACLLLSGFAPTTPPLPSRATQVCPVLGACSA